VAKFLHRERHDDAKDCGRKQPWIDEDACDKQDMPQHKQRYRNDMN
jgi:hypothetical protein